VSPAPSISPGRRLWLQLVAFLVGAYFAIYHRWRVEGRANVRGPLPYMIITNHTSALEWFASLSLAIRWGLSPGVNEFTPSKRELLAVPILGAFFRSLGMIPLDRGNFDLAGARSMLRVLKDGHVLLLAPEGTRSPTGQLQAFQPVIAKLVVSQRVRVIPVGVIGAEKALPFGKRLPRPTRITIRVGPPFELSEYYGREMSPEQVTEAACVMRAHVAELLPEWMRVPPPAGVARRFTVPAGGQRP
jgi:1-acyl-sn-glycerol-3-phosphate acyltransferase